MVMSFIVQPGGETSRMQHYSNSGDTQVVLGATTGAQTVVLEEHALGAARRHSVWSRLRGQRVAMFCLAIILLFVLTALLAPWLAPHDPNLQYDNGLSDSGAPLGSSSQ